MTREEKKIDRLIERDRVRQERKPPPRRIEREELDAIAQTFNAGAWRREALTWDPRTAR